MKFLFVILYVLFTIILCKEGGGGKIKGDKETDKKPSTDSDKTDSYDIEDELDLIANQCCSKTNTKCCISLTYKSSESKQEEVPDEFGGKYYCENMDITKSGDCGNLDYIYLPVSKSCDFTRVLWKLQSISSDKTEDCKGFIRAQSLADGEIVLNNADEFLLRPDDPNNPTGYHALKFPVDIDTQSISICSQLEWGNIVKDIEGKDISIGFSIDNSDRFSCTNSSIRDICSIDTSLAKYDASDAQNKPLNMVNLKGNRNGDNMKNADDPRVDEFINTFEFYWNEYVGLGIAVFAASIFFNIVMCIYWSGYKGNYRNEEDKISKILTDDDDDETEEESDDTDESERDDEDV